MQPLGPSPLHISVLTVYCRYEVRKTIQSWTPPTAQSSWVLHQQTHVLLVCPVLFTSPDSTFYWRGKIGPVHSVTLFWRSITVWNSSYSSNWMVTHRLQLFKEVQRSKPHDVSVVSSTVLSICQVEPALVSFQLTLLILSQKSCSVSWCRSTFTLWISTTHCARRYSLVLSAERWTHIGPSICF